ncbi:hypothetical protein HK405_010497, partial [Cladochytrium tenue]
MSAERNPSPPPPPSTLRPHVASDTSAATVAVSAAPAEVIGSAAAVAASPPPSFVLLLKDAAAPPKGQDIADRSPSTPDYAEAVPALDDPYATAVSRAVGMPCRLVPTILPHQVNFPALLDLLQSGPEMHATTSDAPAGDASAWFGIALTSKNAAEAFAAAV